MAASMTQFIVAQVTSGLSPIKSRSRLKRQESPATRKGRYSVRLIAGGSSRPGDFIALKPC